MTFREILQKKLIEAWEHPPRKYWASVHAKNGKILHQAGPHATRKEAVQAVLAARPTAKSASSGYGEFGGHFDIRSHKKEEADKIAD